MYFENKGNNKILFAEDSKFKNFKVIDKWVDFDENGKGIYERLLSFDGDATFNGTLKANNLSLNSLTLTKNLKIGTTDANSNSSYSLMIGTSTKAEGEYTLAFGRNAQALNWGAIAIGDNNKAGLKIEGQTAPYTSIAIGANNLSTASNAIACGSKNEAKITGSAVFGIGNKTANYPHELARQGQFICGTYNDNTTINNAKFVVGCGTGDSASTRKNALVVRANGNVETSGQLIAKKEIKSQISDYIIDNNTPLEFKVDSGEVNIGAASISAWAESNENYSNHGYGNFTLEGNRFLISANSIPDDVNDYENTDNIKVGDAISITSHSKNWGYISSINGNIGDGIITFNSTYEIPTSKRTVDINGLKINTVYANWDESYSEENYKYELSFLDDKFKISSDIRYK